MNGLFLGLIGGGVVSIATTIGAFLIFYKNNYKKNLSENFNKEAIGKLRLDFVIGFLLLIAAIETRKNIAVVVDVFFLGLLFLFHIKKALGKVLEMIATKNQEQQKAIVFILEGFLKNILIGLAAGAAMSMKHTGEGNSLLAALAFYNLFNGIAEAMCFLFLGLDLFMAISGVIILGSLAIVSGLLGGYILQGALNILPLMMAFAGGGLMSSVLQEASGFMKRDYCKFFLNPKFESAMVVTLIFIIWKELL